MVCSVPDMLADGASGKKHGGERELLQRQLRIGEEFYCLFYDRHRHIDS